MTTAPRRDARTNVVVRTSLSNARFEPLLAPQRFKRAALAALDDQSEQLRRSPVPGAARAIWRPSPRAACVRLLIPR